MTDNEINAAIAAEYGWPADYCNCLNAMHEAEEMITGVIWRDYFERLQRHGKASGIRATARERAEAFLRVLGKWVEPKPKPKRVWEDADAWLDEVRNESREK